MIQKAITIMRCSRVFSLPMTIMSWLIIFTFSLIDSGNIWYGLIALVGLCFAHLGTNLFDDFCDYKSLIKQVNFDKKEYLKNSQKTKCRYIISGIMKESEILNTIVLYFLVACLIGLFLFYKCGIGVAYFAGIGAVIALLYPLASRIYLSEIMVALAYGPALFGGVYYVMTGTYSKEVFILAIPSMIMTVVLLYIHTVMDYHFDLGENKKTLANFFNSQLESLKVLKIFLILAYISVIFLCIFDILDWQIFGVYLTIPIAINLYDSLKEYTVYNNSIPAKKWYHFPMENLNSLKNLDEKSFMFRMLQARNLMLYFSILFIIGIFLSLAI